MRTTLSILTLVAMSSLLAACGGEGRTRGPDTRVVAVHAASSYPQILFMREERVASSLDFTGGAEVFFEVGQYDFNLEVVSPDSSQPVRVKSFSVTLERGTEYYFVITEVGGLLEPLIVTQAPFSPASTNVEASIVHAAPASPTMDIYLAAPGAVLSAANPIGTAGFNQHIAPNTFAPGDYQLSFTEAGNPLNVLFTSQTMAFIAGQSNSFVIADRGDDSNKVVVVRAANAATAVLVDVNAPGALRVINAATDVLPRDVFIDNDFAAPLLAGVPYAAPTARAPIAAGDRTISVTPAGNPGVIEVEAITAIFPGGSYTGLVAGAPGALLLTVFPEDRRRVLGEAHLRYYNAAAQFTAINIFIASAGSGPGFPLAMINGGAEDEFPLPQGDYEISVLPSGSTTLALGPLPITVASEGLYSILFLNGPTADTASVVLFDDFP